jgi:hypothetical protein
MYAKHTKRLKTLWKQRPDDLREVANSYQDSAAIALLITGILRAASQTEQTPWPESASELHRPPLWSSGQSSWIQIQRSGFDSRSYQIFWQVVGLERGPLSHVSATEDLLGRKNSGSSLESREYGLGIHHADHAIPLYPQKLELTSPTSGGGSVGIVRSRTQTTEFVWSLCSTTAV